MTREIDLYLKRVTRQALLIVQALKTGPGDDWNRWQNISRTLSYFVERSDDLNPDDYFKLMKEIYGNRWNSLSALGNEGKQLTFIDSALELRQPRVSSGIRWTELSTPDQFYRTGFKLIGQRFTPDAYIFQQLVSPEVNSRFLPKGVVVMALLGSKEAKQLLRAQGDFKLAGYSEQFEILKEEFRNLSRENGRKLFTGPG